MPTRLMKSIVSDGMLSPKPAIDADTAPSYSLLRMEEHPAVGGDTAAM
jgi:hypothetical protein